MKHEVRRVIEEGDTSCNHNRLIHRPKEDHLIQECLDCGHKEKIENME